MNKTFIIAKREYRAAVRTKGFIISLVILPIFMGGGLAVFALLKDKIDLADKRLVVLDHTGMFGERLMTSAQNWNGKDIFNEKGEKIAPAYSIEMLTPDTVDAVRQKLELSEKVRRKEIHAFIQIGADVLHPRPGEEQSCIYYFAENAAVDNSRNWFGNVINNLVRETRLTELGIGGDRVKDLFYWMPAEAMSLLSVDAKSGSVQQARRSSELQTIMVPYILVLLMFMMLMMSAVPLLSAVMEEKSERIAEVLLGSVTPSQFMWGKIIGSLGVSLTTSAIYIIGIVFTVKRMGLGDIIPYHILPWFFGYLLLNIIMVGSIMASLGAACNDSKDVQAIQFPAMLPIIIPLFFMMPVILNPVSPFATWASFFPLWTPMLMLMRQATSVTIPLWQPIVGLAGVILFTMLCIWAGGRVFRSAIIMQGKKPKPGTLLRYILKG